VDAGARTILLAAGAFLVGVACASRSGDTSGSSSSSSGGSSGSYTAPPCDNPYCCPSDPACQQCFMATFPMPDAGLDAACDAARGALDGAVVCSPCTACPASPPGSNGSSGAGPLVQGPTGCGVGSDDAGKGVLECAYVRVAVPCTN
jgi:hypothetical protein